MADPHKDKVALLLPLEGAAAGGSAVVVDRAGNSLTVGGNCTYSTAVAPPYGANSLSIPSNETGVVVASPGTPAIGTRDFTVELWYSPKGFANWYAVFSTGAWNSGNSFSWICGTTSLKANISGTDTSGYTHGMSTGQWYHLAFVRRNGVGYSYLNGVLKDSDAVSGNIVGNVYRLGTLVSGDIVGGGNFYAKGFRLTVGLARYTGNFSVSNPRPLPWDEPEQPRIML